MAYETVHACCAENLRLLKPAGFLVAKENMAMWNLSKAILHLAAAVEEDLSDLKQQVRVLRSEIQRLSRQ